MLIKWQVARDIYSISKWTHKYAVNLKNVIILYSGTGAPCGAPFHTEDPQQVLHHAACSLGSSKVMLPIASASATAVATAAASAATTDAAAAVITAQKPTTDQTGAVERSLN